ncbi:MAG: LacI family transcriptional regulator [Gracilibacteraceae bacterium]|nr:LacI family transcriptional regulator [Gracilibacteraceae bacterium]
MTLKEIAARAGVHVSTVSRVLSSADDSFGSREIRERIWAIAREAGYVPNPNAQALRQKPKRTLSYRKGTLACVLARAKSLEDNPFFAHIARAAEQQALALGYSMRAPYSLLEETKPEAAENSEKALGVIVLGHFAKEEIVRLLENRYQNIVMVGRAPVKAEWDQIICDGREAAEIALRHLIGYGHERIGYIGETGQDVSYLAFRDILREHGIAKEERLIAECAHNSPEGGYQGADALLRQAAGRLPTAVFCRNDVAAIAAIRRFKEEKIKIPERLSLVSLDNIVLSGYASPMITTVGAPITEMGIVAALTLISRVNKLHRSPLKIYLPNRLIARESVGNLNAGMYI